MPKSSFSKIKCLSLIATLFFINQSSYSAVTFKKEINIAADIDYSYNFDADSKNFQEAPQYLVESGVNGYQAFVNIHGDAELNTSSTFDPKKRTLSWWVPLEQAMKVFDTVNSAHELLALPETWSGNAHRNNLSIIYVPGGKVRMKYKIGLAEPQGTVGDDYYKGGSGLQMRMAKIPAGVKIAEYNLFPAAVETDAAKLKATKKPIEWKAIISMESERLKKITGMPPAELTKMLMAINPNIGHPMDPLVVADFACSPTEITPIDSKGMKDTKKEVTEAATNLKNKVPACTK